MAEQKDIDATLTERGKRYGDFSGHARVTYDLKRAMYAAPNFRRLPDDMKEALDMIAHKIGRILNGDPFYDDSWRDIAGYARLIETRILAGAAPKPQADPAQSPAPEPVTCVKASPSEIAKRFANSLSAIASPN